MSCYGFHAPPPKKKILDPLPHLFYHVLYIPQYETYLTRTVSM